ncbi:MAG: hypothetical protein GX605_13165 [Chloroflexi bacterium]|nr:hypothetical protein [Chloroflexota bacterium]
MNARKRRGRAQGPLYRFGMPLRSIPDFPPERAQQLAGLWVITAEELVSLAATPKGLDGLSRLLEMDSHEVETLVEIASEYLPPDEAQAFAQEADEAFALGALWEDDDHAPEPPTEQEA